MQKLERVAKDLSAVVKPSPALMLAKSMVSYRCGRFKDAMASLPETGFADPREELLSLIFRAMIHHHVGDTHTRHTLLEKARRAVENKLPTPVGTALRNQDRPVAWCMVQTALREAQALIEPAE
jgi:hypothetical protein